MESFVTELFKQGFLAVLMTAFLVIFTRFFLVYLKNGFDSNSRQMMAQTASNLSTAHAVMCLQQSTMIYQTMSMRLDRDLDDERIQELQIKIEQLTSIAEKTQKDISDTNAEVKSHLQVFTSSQISDKTNIQAVQDLVALLKK